MEGHKNNDWFQSQRTAEIYLRYRPSYPITAATKIMEFMRQKKIGGKFQALEVGCGSGQLTKVMSGFFDNYIAIDISAEQIKLAEQYSSNDNVIYKVGVAEDLPADDCSVDLVISAEAFHYFDPVKYVSEATRVLKPNGTFALLTGANFEFIGDHADMINDIYNDWWTNPKHVPEFYSDVFKTEYNDVHLSRCFEDVQRNVIVKEKIGWNVEEMIGLWGSYGFHQKYLQENPHKPPLTDSYRQRIRDVLNATADVLDKDITIEAERRIAIVLARKSSDNGI